MSESSPKEDFGEYVDRIMKGFLSEKPPPPFIFDSVQEVGGELDWMWTGPPATPTATVDDIIKTYRKVGKVVKEWRTREAQAFLDVSRGGYAIIPIPYLGKNQIGVSQDLYERILKEARQNPTEEKACPVPPDEGGGSVPPEQEVPELEVPEQEVPLVGRVPKVEVDPDVQTC